MKSANSPETHLPYDSEADTLDVMDTMDTKEREFALRWLEIAATMASLIGIVGILALLSQGAWAENPPEGFKPNPRTFTNPFANTGNPSAPPPPGNFFDEGDDEDEPEAPVGRNYAPPPAYAGAGTSSASPSSNSDSRSSSKQGTSVSAGGGAPGGLIAKQSVEPLFVDDESGEGSKEVITDFNFPDADIMDIAKTLGKLTGKNFILDKDVKGRITIIANAPITVGDAWRAFLTALDINHFALIPSGKFIRIARDRDAREKQLRTFSGDLAPDSDALITRVIPIKHINAEELARIFRSFMPANSRVHAYEQTNTLIITDTGSNIAKLSKMLEILDVEGYDAGIEVIPVKFAAASQLSDLLDKLLPGTGGRSGAPGSPRMGGGGKFSARRTKEGGVINTIIADERTNNLIVHANAKGADQVRELVAKLDQRLPAAVGGKIRVRFLQFADATELAATLNNLSQGSGAKSMPGAGMGTGINPNAQSLFEGSIRVAADKTTNALVITASASDYLTVETVVNRLDIQRDQVYVEAVIMEIAMNRDFAFSTNLISPVNGVALAPNTDLFDFLANPLSQQGAILSFPIGTTKDYTIGTQTVKIGNIQTLIKAIQTNSRSNVLATPQIIALDNSEAFFESAEKIPVPTTTISANVGSSNSFTKESVPLSMRIKPQINKLSNFIKLDVDMKLSDVSERIPAELKGKAFGSTDRSVKTNVIVGDSDTVVIGGLIRDKTSEAVSKIPLLGDIPLLGWLFRASKSTTEKTNLLVFLTPHIVRQYDKIRAILDNKLKERDDFIENYAGGNDPLRPKRDDIIRSLPNIKDLTTQPAQAAALLDEGKPAAVVVEPGPLASPLPPIGVQAVPAPVPPVTTHEV
ncbi:type II secretion system secretin GspD, partial [Bdellovibrionota bacterium FG-2]